MWTAVACLQQSLMCIWIQRHCCKLWSSAASGGQHMHGLVEFVIFLLTQTAERSCHASSTAPHPHTAGGALQQRGQPGCQLLLC